MNLRASTQEWRESRTIELFSQRQHFIEVAGEGYRFVTANTLDRPGMPRPTTQPTNPPPHPPVLRRSGVRHPEGDGVGVLLELSASSRFDPP